MNTARFRTLIVPRLASLGTLLGLIALIALFGVLKPDVFFTALNASNIVEQIAVLTMVAAVQTVVMVVGDFDLSVGALASVTGIIVAQLMVQGVHPVLAVLVGLAAGVLAGAINGFLVAYLGLSAFIATLATMTSFTGLALMLANGTTVFGLPEGFIWLGQGRVGLGGVLGEPSGALHFLTQDLAMPTIIAAILVVIMWFVLARTVIGRSWYAIGGNPEAARLSGVHVRAIRLIAFVTSGFGAALAGIVLAARLASAHPTAGDPMMLSSIAAVFLGITLSRAGQPTIPGTLVGLGIVGVLSNGLNMLHVNSYIQQVLTGVIIIMAVSLSRVSAGLQARGR